MSIDTLLSRLDKVVDRGHGQYYAKCPAHDDKSPSLSIKDDNGKILLHCFAECSKEEILSAVGLTFSDLFPKDHNYYQPSKKPRWNATDLLKILSRESTVVYVAACDLEAGKKLSDSDMQRLQESVRKLNNVLEVTRAIS